MLMAPTIVTEVAIILYVIRNQNKFGKIVEF